MGTKPRESLRQLAPYRPATKHDEPFGHGIQFGKFGPQCVARDIAHVVQAGQLGNKRFGAGSDDNRTGGQALYLSVMAFDLDGPGVD